MSAPNESFPDPQPRSAPAAADLPIPCPSCGYDLRGNTTGRCPECGTELDEAALSSRAAIPWQERRRIGRIRAFVRTVVFAMRRPGQLARQAGREVEYRDARRFHLICCLIAWLCFTPILIIFWHEITVAFPAGRPLSATLADFSVILALAVGLFLWLCTASAVHTYFFHPRALPVILQDRAIAISYYAAAPLAVTPIAAAATVFALLTFEGWDPDEPPIMVQAGVFLFAGVAWLLVLAEMLVLPLILLARGLNASGGRLLACGAAICVGWPVLFVLFALGLPLLVLYVQVAWHTLR